MDIQVQRKPDGALISLRGRMDTPAWEKLEAEFEKLEAEKIQRIQMEMQDVSYVSSGGLRMLWKRSEKIRHAGGELRVISASRYVRNAFDLGAVASLLHLPVATVEDAPEEPVKQTASGSAAEVPDDSGQHLNVFPMGENRTLKARFVGNPTLLETSAFCDGDQLIYHPGPGRVAIGLGAVGEFFEDCSWRFGEFLSVGEAACYQPTDGRRDVAESVVAGSGNPAASQLLYGITLEGECSHFMRFEKEAGALPFRLSEMVVAMLDAMEAELAGMVMVLNVQSLVAASLARSPVRSGARRENPFASGSIQDWFRYHGRCHPDTVALVAGVASRGNAGGLEGVVCPMGFGSGVQGHFHAAVFPGGKLPGGRVLMAKEVHRLFSSGMLQHVCHLMSDERPGIGLGESQFVEGMAWAGPLEAKP